ncbi:MAG: hypothetical protein RDU01_05120 [Thermodesulfovibrionales bacterium]|nr:hypothetical protein [Thermodesulfovibrionales bacterium]
MSSDEWLVVSFNYELLSFGEREFEEKVKILSPYPLQSNDYRSSQCRFLNINAVLAEKILKNLYSATRKSSVRNAAQRM